MSRVIPIAAQTHLDQGVRTMCECLVVTQTAVGSSAILRVTTASDVVTITTGAYAGTYLPLGYVRHDWATNDAVGVPNSEVGGFLAPIYLTEEDLRIGRWKGAEWVKFTCNYNDPDAWQIHRGSGFLGQVHHGRLRFTAELVGLLQLGQNGIGNLNSPLCLHDFGKGNPRNRPELGNGCTFDLETVTDTGTVEAVDSDFYGIHDSARTEPDFYYSNGIFRIADTNSPYNGMEFEIRAYTVGFWITFTAVPADITGTAYEIVRGCDKTLAACLVFGLVQTDRLASDFTQGNDAAIAVARSGS